MLTFLTTIAFLAAVVGGIVGMGGGTLLLASIFCFMPHGQAVPLHGAVMLVTNSSRVVAFWKDVDWRTVGRFSIGAVPGAAIGGLVLWRLGELRSTEPYLKTAIGLYILVLTYLPKPKKRVGTTARKGWTAMGLIAGASSLTVGAIGPLIAPLFVRRDFVKERLVATKAVVQMITHALKLPMFWLIGTIQLAEFSRFLVCMSIVVIPGTFLGKRLLHRVSPRVFVLLYKAALTIAGFKLLIIDGVFVMFGWAVTSR